MIHFLDPRKVDELLSLIVLDVNLPAQSGWDILVTLQKNDQYRTIPTVMFSTADPLYYETQQEQYGVRLLTELLTYPALEKVWQAWVTQAGNQQYLEK